MTVTTNEPVAAGAIGLGLVQAIIALLAAFHVGLTVDQVAAVEGVYVALVAAVAFLVRQHVAPVNRAGTTVTTTTTANPFVGKP